MRGNTFGKLLSMTTFGESHGLAMGVVIDGMPSNLDFSLSDLQQELDRRRPGNIVGTTSRKEEDRAEVLSGIFENKTLGSPIAVIVRNTNQKSQDYDKLKNEMRPGHADNTTLLKYGIRDHRGGGRSSGRETLCRVIGGYFASLVLKNVTVRAITTKLGPFVYDKIMPDDLSKDFGPYSFPCDIDGNNRNEEIKNYLLELKKQGNSVGGCVRVIVDSCPLGLGEPAFDKLKSDLGRALLSIGAVVGFSLGRGFEMANLFGKDISSDINNFGGIEGGISNGEKIILDIVFKPTSTVGEKALEGRHDPCIIPRAIPVVEAMVKFTLADHYLRQNAYSV